MVMCKVETYCINNGTNELWQRSNNPRAIKTFKKFCITKIGNKY
jgi:hypothetical protein